MLTRAVDRQLRVAEKFNALIVWKKSTVNYAKIILKWSCTGTNATNKFFYSNKYYATLK